MDLVGWIRASVAARWIPFLAAGPTAAAHRQRMELGKPGADDPRTEYGSY